MIKIMLMSTYEDMVNYQVEILKENAELRKVCQCRECKHFYEDYICDNRNSDNYKELMSLFGSCEKCERR